MNFSTLSLFQAFVSRVNNNNSNNANDKTTKQQPKTLAPSSETWAAMSSTVASLMFAWAIICQYSPYEVRGVVDKLKRVIRDYLNPRVQISFHESTGERMKRGEAYALVEAYLASKASAVSKRLRADMETEGSELVLCMDDYEEVNDVFRGVHFLWTVTRVPESRRAPYYEQGRRLYVVTFHRRHRAMATSVYLDHVMRAGKEARAQKRQRKLYTNVAGSDRMGGNLWSHVVFEHPARLENMALEPATRDEIFEDLVAFSRNKDFYERAGRAWKRGYLLHGPPGTGKSTMVAAMANLLNYDVYDLELTAVHDNTELRKLLIETTSKSVIVIEDIDCSLDLTGRRKKKNNNNNNNNKTENSDESLDEDDGDNADEPKKKKMMKKKEPRDERPTSQVTLSGLLNFIDGIWSACGSERLIVFTTNHVEKLDPALIRSGRMDKHIELSYCTFEGFKVLARNYLGVESHPMFDEIERLIREVEITPADVAESLVPRSAKDGPERCLSNLVRALEKAKDKKRAEEEDSES